jgi:hypothetical protein
VLLPEGADRRLHLSHPGTLQQSPPARVRSLTGFVPRACRSEPRRLDLNEREQVGPIASASRSS